MSRVQKIVFVTFLVLLGVLVYAEAAKPVPLNWFPSYSKEDKIPLGTYVLHDLLSENFQDSFQETDLPPYVQLRENEFEGTYMFINDHIVFDDTELDYLLDWVSGGNSLFISANQHSANLLDSLKLKSNSFYFYDQLHTEPLLNLVNEKLASEKPFHIKKNLTITYFEEIDTLSHIVLGVSQAYKETSEMIKPEANYLKIPYGIGTIYLHNQPEIFSNYFLLDGNNFTHSQNVLSYINDGNIIYWDNYHKNGKRVDLSPLKVILSNKGLKWAYYFFLIGVLFFVLFEGKRKQRSIPIIKPLTNKTYEYTQTISSIYRERKDNKEVVNKMFSQFHEYIRAKLRISTEPINKRFFEEVAHRSGNTFDDIKAIFDHIQKYQRQAQITNEELKELYKELKQFKTKADGK